MVTGECLRKWIGISYLMVLYMGEHDTKRNFQQNLKQMIPLMGCGELKFPNSKRYDFISKVIDIGEDILCPLLKQERDPRTERVCLYDLSVMNYLV